MPVPSSHTSTATPEISSSEAVPMLDLRRQYASIKDEVLEAVEGVLTSQYFIGGPQLEAFERESAEYLGVKDSVGCASGTDALWLALQTSGIAPGASVITTPFSFFATASSITRCGATPVFADVDAATLNLDPGAVEKVLDRENRVRALMPVHLYGQCANMDRLGRMATERGLAVVEDAAQAFGAKWHGRKAGTLGKAAGFSFYPSKNLSACGDGGCVTTDDEDVAAHVRRLRNHGSRQRYHHEEIGWNSRLDAMQAAVLRVKLKHIDQWNQMRRDIAGRYDLLLSQAGLVRAGSDTITRDAPVSPVATRAAAHHIYHQYVVRAWKRDELRSHLAAQRIASEIYYPVPLHLQECFAGLGYKRGDFPESERAAGEVIALPMFPELREDEQQRVVSAIAQFYAGGHHGSAGL